MEKKVVKSPPFLLNYVYVKLNSFKKSEKNVKNIDTVT